MKNWKSVSYDYDSRSGFDWPKCRFVVLWYCLYNQGLVFFSHFECAGCESGDLYNWSGVRESENDFRFRGSLNQILVSEYNKLQEIGK